MLNLRNGCSPFYDRIKNIGLNIYILIITILVIAGIIIRPFRLSEAVWAVAGAVLLVALGFLPFRDAVTGIKKGMDVYLFLIGMMLLAETAREEKLFDWLAASATRASNGSSKRLFILIYISGIIVTAFLSNDATAVVMTPAVAVAVKTAKAKNPIPYLLICAFVANAASFIFPISNPANLVIYNGRMPPLFHWIIIYGLSAFISVSGTFILLFLTQKKKLSEKIKKDLTVPTLEYGGRIALMGIGITAVVLLVCSALDIPLGLPTALTGAITSLVVLILDKKTPVKMMKGVSWSVIPFVAALFVIVEALDKTGFTQILSSWIRDQSDMSVNNAAWMSGLIIGFGSNVMNNLPAGLIAAEALHTAHVHEIIRSAVLVGVDLGPNLSVTGSLATILWLIALRREGIFMSAWKFLKLGIVMMIPVLILALLALWI